MTFIDVRVSVIQTSILNGFNIDIYVYFNMYFGTFLIFIFK